MRRLSRFLNRLMWGLFLLAGFYIVFHGGQRFWPQNMGEFFRQGVLAARRGIQQEAARCLYPGLFFQYEEEEGTDSFYEWYIQRALAMHPLYKLQHGARHKAALESAATYDMLVTGGVHDEKEQTDAEEVEALAREENERIAKQQKAAEEEARKAAEEAEKSAAENAVPAGTIYNLEELSDFDYLFRNFYTMESTTTIAPEDLNAETLLSRDMHIDKETGGPQILIYHTHSQEGFVDSVPGDNSTTIVGVGAYLAQLLREKGYDVMHVTSVYDLVDGKLDRNEAYTKAEKEISAILAENPSIQSVIDLHRDGVREDVRLVKDVGGKPSAKLMFFNGLSRTKRNGPIAYLHNPYIQDNLALTLQLKLACEQYYPGLSRNIYLKSMRYNLHLSDKALLIEVGAQTNTLQEMLNTMEPLADILDKVFN